MFTRSSSLRSLSLSLICSALLGALGCSGDARPGSSSAASTCEQYLGCLDAVAKSGGAAASTYSATLDQARAQYGAGGACDTNAQTRSQCDAACSGALTSAAQAFPALAACTTQQTLPGPNAGGGGSGPCKAYLSCVLATSPSTYAQALTVYGDKAACWDTSAQAASCDSACSASLVDLKDVCACSGSTCTAYHRLTSGTYGYTVTRTSTDSTCPVIAMGAHAAMLERFSNTSYQIEGSVQSTENSPFGGTMVYTDDVVGKLVVDGNAGSITWTINGQPGGGGAVVITADDAFEAGLDRYGDTTCVYRVAFTKS